VPGGQRQPARQSGVHTGRDRERVGPGGQFEPERRAQEPWLRRWVAAGVPPATVFDATETVTAFVVGFVIEEQERLQSAADPSRYSPRERDRRLGSDVPLVTASGHARHDDQARFERQLRTVIAGIGSGSA
jgi:hypothetical protein